MIFSEKQLLQMREIGCNFYRTKLPNEKRGVTRTGEAISLSNEKFRVLQTDEDFKYAVTTENFCAVITEKSKLIIIDDDTGLVKIPRALAIKTYRKKKSKESAHYLFCAKTEEDVKLFQSKHLKPHEIFSNTSTNVIDLQGIFVAGDNTLAKWCIDGGDMELLREIPVVSFSDFKIPGWHGTSKNIVTRRGVPDVTFEGQNRGNAILSRMQSASIEDPTLIKDLEKFKEKFYEISANHTMPQKTEKELEILLKQSIKYASDVSEANNYVDELNEDIDWISRFIDVVDLDYEIAMEKHDTETDAIKSKKMDKATKYLALGGLNYAHISRTHEDQFDAYVWDKKTWRVDAQNIVLQLMKHFDKIYAFGKGDDFGTINEIATKAKAVNYVNLVSAKQDTLKTDIENVEYAKVLQLQLTDNAGHYYDVSSGEIKDVDPTKFFFKNNMFDFDLTQIDDEEPQMLKLLEEVIPDEYQRICFKNMMASTLLPINDVLDGRVKMTFMVGPKWTYKTTICDTFSSIFNSDYICNVRTEEMADKFAISMLGDSYLNIIDETNNEAVSNPAALKEIITLKRRKGDVKNKKTQKIFYKFPRHFIPCNILPPIPDDDKSDAMLDRMAIIQFRKTDNAKWGKIINSPVEIQRLALYLLKKATQIYQDQNMQYQDVKEIRGIYEGMIGGKMKKFLEKYYNKNELGVIGSYASLMKSGYEVYIGDRVSWKTFNQMLEMLKITKDGKYDRSSGYIHPNKGLSSVLYVSADGDGTQWDYERGKILVHGYSPRIDVEVKHEYADFD